LLLRIKPTYINNTIKLHSKLLTDLLDAVEVGQIGVNHHTIGVSVDHIQLHRGGGIIHRALQRLATHGSHQRGDRAGVKTRETEPQTAVHTVGGQLEGLLADVELLLQGRVGLLLVQVLHHSVIMECEWILS